MAWLESELASELNVTDDRLVLRMRDGREVSVPLSLYPSLQKASPSIRRKWQALSGIGFHWPDLDLDLSTDQLLHGQRESFPKPPPTPAWARGAKRCRVFPSPDGWFVSARFTSEPFSVYPSQVSAVAAAKRLISNVTGPCSIVVHARDGHVRRTINVPTPKTSKRASAPTRRTKLFR
jgi:Protein of unknown function (DUF2442)/Uncharacterized protein conserved in bacteria (DUF2188)